MDQAPVQRNPFLSILCRLSFLKGGATIFLNLPSLLVQGSPEPYTGQPEQPLTPPPDPFVAGLIDDMTDILEHLAQHYSIIILSTLILAAMSLMGTWMMWNLRKTGFLFYATAQVLWTIMPLVFFGSSTLLYIAFGVDSLLTIAFLVMYGTQLKHMS